MRHGLGLSAAPTASRRALLAGAGLLAAGVGGARAQDAPVRVRDLLNREVVLPRPARRLVLGAGRHLAVLNLLHPDPASLLVGWNDDLKAGQAGEYDAFRRRFPALDAVPVLSHGNEPMHAENVLALRPDLVLLTRTSALDGQLRPAAPGAPPPAPGVLMRTLEAAGVPVAVVDFFQQPLADTRPSVELLGRVLGREDQAARFLAFYEGRIGRVRALPAPEPRPAVFMHAHAGGLDCSYSPGRGTFDEFITLAGGRNIAASRLSGVTGQLGLEYVLSADPAVYVATGGPYGGRGGVSLGAGVDAKEARDSLADELRRQHLDGLSAVRNGRAHALWHGFNDSPAHVLAVEVLARWLRPGGAASGVDPAETLRELNRFAAVPMEGTYWVDLAEA